jgi:FkbM family methyltransferase
MITIKELAQEIKGYAGKNYSQTDQDIMVLILTKFKKEGFFVEFGACDGINLSNTYLLESDFNWDGIVAEAIPDHFSKLKENRNCKVDNRAVFHTTGQTVDFRIVKDAFDISGISETLENDQNASLRETNYETIEVQTVSLNDLLSQHNAPHHIDYLSIDTEGSELSILTNFDFSKHVIDIISVEHNYIEENKTNIFELLSSKGYVRISNKKSKQDDWYALKSFFESL